MSSEAINLAQMKQSVDRLWDSSASDYVPLELAAAFLFHQVHADAAADVSRLDYCGALDIAAAALARLAPVYDIRDSREPREPLAIDVATQCFRNGASELKGRDGTLFTRLATDRSAVLLAVPVARKAQLPFGISSVARGAEPRPGTAV